MDWTLVITSEDLGLPRGTPEQLRDVVSRLRRDVTVRKALQFAAALGTDVKSRYRTVDGLLMPAAPEPLRSQIENFRQNRPNDHFIFFEPWQQLLVARHVREGGSDAADALDTESADGRAAFFDACRIVNDLSMPPAPPLVGEPVTDALIVAANMAPRMWLMNPPNANDAQARLLAFLEEIPREHPERADAAAMLRDRFRDDLGVSFDDAIDLTAFLGYWSITQRAEDILRDINQVCVGPDAWLQHLNLPRETFDAFVRRVAQPVADLHPRAPAGAGSAWFDPLGFRDRPLVRFENNTYLVTMPELLMEKAGFDMLWWLTSGPGGGLQRRAWQEAFGQLCETYVLDVLRATDGAAVHTNVTWDAGEIDGLVCSGDRLAVIEICSGFMANAPKMSGDHVRFGDELRRRYVEHTAPDGAIDREAVAQLARDIEWLLTCRRAGNGPAVPLRDIQSIHPVVVAADRTARTHGIWRYLDSELRQRLPPDMPWEVAPLAVLGLEDVEWIEQAARDRHPRLLQGALPPVLQTLRLWQFGVGDYPAFWQLLGDFLGEGQPNSRLEALFDRRRQQMRARFRNPPPQP